MTGDPLDERSPPHAHWTTGNIGEAVPGVPTPLSWTLFGPAIEGAMRGALIATGAYAPAELPAAFDPDDRIVGIFSGRPAMLLDSMALLGDRMPGTSGRQVMEGFYGSIPDDMEFSPTVRRYPAIAWKLPRSHFGIASELGRVTRETPQWHLAMLGLIGRVAAPAAAVAAFGNARERFDRIVLLQAIAAVCAVQPSFDAVSKLAASAGVTDVNGLTSGYGDVPEAAVIRDVWRASRAELTFEELARRHGHHGPLEGELSARVWREQDGPLRRLVEEYAARPDEESPMLIEAERAREREQLERAVLAGIAAPSRPIGRALLARARRTIPLRGAAKGQFLRAFDVARAAARRAGELYVAAGVLDDPEDVFYLTVEELTASPPDGVRESVGRRRAWRTEHEQVRLPTVWTGTPSPLEEPPEEVLQRDELEGIGVSGGVIEGRARVVTDPTFAEVKPGEVLVSATTDPGWASTMFVSSALVVDIGGHLSHAAVVARELGIPCVVDTGDGSRAISSGDLVRVDGDRGTVRILERTATGEAGRRDR